MARSSCSAGVPVQSTWGAPLTQALLAAATVARWRPPVRRQHWRYRENQRRRAFRKAGHLAGRSAGSDYRFDGGHDIAQSLNSGTNVTEQTTSGAASGAGQQTSGLGDINVNSAIGWSNAAATHAHRLSRHQCQRTRERRRASRDEHHERQFDARERCFRAGRSHPQQWREFYQ